MQNSGFWSRITSLYRYQTSPVVLCMQNRVISTRITSLSGFQPSSVEKQISIGPRYHQSFCACNTAWLAPEFLVSMGSSPHRWFLLLKQLLLDQNYKSLWVPDLTCRLCTQNSVISTKITSLYGSQPSSVVFACKTAALGSESQVSMGPRYDLWFCAWKTAWLAPEILVSMGPSPHLRVLHSKQRILGQNYKSLWVPDLTNRFVHAKQRDLLQNDKSICVPDLICGFEHT